MGPGSKGVGTTEEGACDTIKGVLSYNYYPTTWSRAERLPVIDSSTRYPKTAFTPHNGGYQVQQGRGDHPCIFSGFSASWLPRSVAGSLVFDRRSSASINKWIRMPQYSGRVRNTSPAPFVAVATRDHGGDAQDCVSKLCSHTPPNTPGDNSRTPFSLCSHQRLVHSSHREKQGNKKKEKREMPRHRHKGILVSLPN